MVIRQLIVLVETTTIVCYIILLTVDNPIVRYLYLGGMRLFCISCRLA
jgi:hypothetical protein